MFLVFICYRFYKNNIQIMCEKTQRSKKVGTNIYISNTSYYHCGESTASYIIGYNSYYNNYSIDLGLFRSKLQITKNKQCRKRFLKLLIDLNNVIYYSYFIYNKYYNFVDKNYIILINSSIKLFNCRDYYKIHSYIIT